MYIYTHIYIIYTHTYIGNSMYNRRKKIRTSDYRSIQQIINKTTPKLKHVKNLPFKHIRPLAK